MKSPWHDLLPPFLRWRVIYWVQHYRIKWLRFRQSEPELAGIKIPVVRQLTDNICAAIYAGYYERAELSTFQEKLEAQDIVLEVGAGIGFLSSYCSSVIGSGNVFAYEANPGMEKLIRRVYQANQVHRRLRSACLASRQARPRFMLPGISGRLLYCHLLNLMKKCQFLFMI